MFKIHINIDNVSFIHEIQFIDGIVYEISKALNLICSLSYVVLDPVKNDSLYVTFVNPIPTPELPIYLIDIASVSEPKKEVSLSR